MKTTVIVPAYNEAALIESCLAPLADGLRAGRFAVVVVANGCTDDTAVRSRAVHPAIKVIELDESGKANAVDIGRRAAQPGIHVHLDGDLVVDGAAIEALVAPLRRGEALAACGRMDVDLAGAHPFVCAFYSVWRLNPYFDHGKFGGLFALSPDGQRRVGVFSGHIADDEHARRSFRPHEVAFVPACSFTARAPRTVAGLLKVRQRSRRGTRALAAAGGPKRSTMVTAVRVLRRPRLWPAAVVYGALCATIRLLVALERTSMNERWERDESARQRGNGAPVARGGRPNPRSNAPAAS